MVRLNGIKKGYNFIFLGLVYATSYRSIITNDPSVLWHIYNCSIALLLITIGFMEILYTKNSDKIKIISKLLLGMLVYALFILIIHYFFQGVITIIISLILYKLAYDKLIAS